MKKLRSTSGFTLVELIVVLVILAVLAAILVPTLTGYITQAQNQKDYDTAAELRQAAQSVLVKQYGQMHPKGWSYENLQAVKSNESLETDGNEEGDYVLKLAGVDRGQVDWFYFNVSADGSITPTVMTGSRAHAGSTNNQRFPSCASIQGKIYYMQDDGSWAAAAKNSDGTFTTSPLTIRNYHSNATSTGTSWNPSSVGY